MPISQFWICDSEGRILGPLALESLPQLLKSGRVKQIVRIRKNSERWQRPKDCPELAAALGISLPISSERPKENARGATPPLGSGHLAHRSAAYAKEAVKQQSGYGPEELVGIVQGQDLVQATVRVSGQNVGIFTDNSLVNLATQGVFLPTTRFVRLGTLVELRFVFETAARQVQARGRVVCVNVGVPSAQPGFGVRFLRLDQADRLFIEHFVAQEKTLAASAQTPTE